MRKELDHTKLGNMLEDRSEKLNDIRALESDILRELIECEATQYFSINWKKMLQHYTGRSFH